MNACRQKIWQQHDALRPARAALAAFVNIRLRQLQVRRLHDLRPRVAAVARNICEIGVGFWLTAAVCDEKQSRFHQRRPSGSDKRAASSSQSLLWPTASRRPCTTGMPW